MATRPSVHFCAAYSRTTRKSCAAGWGSRFSVSPNNFFALLTHVGEDVAGAAQFVRETAWTRHEPLARSSLSTRHT